jgi:16S rRNA G527 N7-methylase RsmG
VDTQLARQPWAKVREVLKREGVKDVEPTLVRLRRYAELLIQWNRSVSNLISKNDEERLVDAHLLPSIEVVSWMKSFNLQRWCDLGSGGGLPALPLAICGIGTEWDLVESRRTKTLFLQRAVGELGLGGIRVLAARIEDLVADLGGASEADAEGDSEWVEEEGDLDEGDSPRFSLRSPYDGFTSRATMALVPTLDFAAPIVRLGGRAFLWKGSKLDAEAAENSRWQSEWRRGEARSLAVEHSVVAEFERIERP